ncbi:hypothetical protein BGX23_008387 [Mortierella sp. AD031]|nr:hypothetical protein BGX23_008387 [Mortierella sp. AD031]
MSRQDSLRIIDKRQNISGTEYLFNSGDWIASSTSRRVNSELVELYEYLHNSGFRKGANVFNPLLRPRLVQPRGTRRRIQSASGSTTTALSPTTTETPLSAISQTTVESQETSAAATPVQPSPGQDAEQITSNGPYDQGNQGDADSSVQRQPFKKPRLEKVGSYSSGLSQLSIHSTPDNEDTVEQKDSQRSGPASPSTTRSSPKEADRKSATEDSSRQATPTPTGPSQPKKDMAIVEFNKNTENMIVIYFKEGMDATGVEMFDMLLGPKRRPMILSPLTEPATIEAAIHVLDRVLTLHGPEPFQAIWDVQKRRREFADGTSPFSKVSASSEADSGSRGSSMSSRSSSGVGKKPKTLRDLSSAALAGRLPSWNNIWDVIKAEFGLDPKEETKQHIALQEHQIRLRLQGSEAAVELEHHYKELEDDEADGLGRDSKSGTSISEQQEIRDEIGRAIVGFLLRVFEQDAVLNNMSQMSFFCRDALSVSRYNPSQAIRQALDLSFQIIGLATSSRYFEPHSRLNPTDFSVTKPLAKAGRATSPWPVNERCTLNAAGLEILQLGQQIILLLIRFTEAGELLPGKGLEELAREVLSRLSKVNKDRKIPPLSRVSSVPPFLLERYTLDQTEVFLKALIQGPCLLETGTGFGASVKLRKDAALKQQQGKDSLISNGAGGNVNGAAADFVIDPDESNGLFKSQIGTCTGSSVFVMILVDHWFRTSTTSCHPGNALSFRAVVEIYTMPGQLRPSTSASASTASSPTTARSEASKKRSGTTTRRNRRDPAAADDMSQPQSDEGEMQLMSIQAGDDEDNPGYEQWNAKDLEQIEWAVMMTEVLIWAWIEARGVRRDEIQGTGLEQVLFPEEVGPPSLETHPHSGWLEMSEVLAKVGGTLKSRWDQLESVIEAALLVEDLGLR